MNLEVAPVNKASLSKQVADQLQEAIIDGSLKADDRLPTEDELAKRFQVSRPTIREALKRLAAKNLIRSRRGPAGGTFVNRLDANELSDNLTTASTLFVSMNDISLDEISSTRLELESLCCQLACQNHSEQDLEKMQQELLHQTDESISPEEFCAADVRFHRAIADASHNRMLSFVMYTLIEALQPVSNMIAYHYREREIIINQHKRMLKAIQDRDTNLCVAILKEQIDYFAQLHEEAQLNHKAKS
ncbi:FadR/GntR family transcriptional regulator [Neptuniibacter sp.]|uniref:FadR/GntR family transcriptional regulator n=1 Tax=Neptuniibacter sp. TaxID=1962643 RepID=UPI002608B3F4|nr:FadR/GntR family transcriptional regulator [Neptuniibacter sp.]MCP4598650.1 FadR family transcriptional regulator [Neptuniibacter sp.]